MNIIGVYDNLHHRMSTGQVLNHGVSGYPCLGRPGDFQDQRRGEPWQVIVNDPIRSYMNAQSHIGIPMSNFNEFWTGGELREANFDAAPYRTPIFGEPEQAPLPNMPSITVAPIKYPNMIGMNFPQQLPSARIHENVRLAIQDRQNIGWEGLGYNKYVEGHNQVVLPHTSISTDPNTVNFQGASTATGTHPNNDVANQQTTANTQKTEFVQGQTPYQKLPNGTAIGALQAQEPPALWELASPPDPPVLPGEGTAPLRPTNPAWW